MKKENAIKTIQKWLDYRFAIELKYGEYEDLFTNVKVSAYPQSFGRLDVIIESKYAYVSKSGVTRFKEIAKLCETYDETATRNFLTSFYHAHKKGGQK